jgi:arylformamidase
MATIENDGFDVSKILLSAHTGTHFDASLHFGGYGKTVDHLDFETIIGEAVVFDLTANKPTEGDKP